jgi:hypothetical protein
MNCRCMEKDSNFSASRGNQAQWPALRQTLENVPDSRPEAVERARKLIADPNYPSQRTLLILARHLAQHLTDETDPFPT